MVFSNSFPLHYVVPLLDDSDDDEDRPARKRRMAERAAEGGAPDDDEEVNIARFEYYLCKKDRGGCMANYQKNFWV